MNRIGNWDSELFVFRNDSVDALVKEVSSFLDAIDSLKQNRAPNVSLGEIAKNQNNSVAPLGLRLAIVASTIEDLQSKLTRAVERLEKEDCQRIWDVTGIYFSANPLGADSKIAFLFPGEGAQFLGMTAGLESAFPSAKMFHKLCEELADLAEVDQPPVTRFFEPVDSYDDEAKERLNSDLRRIDTAMFSVLVADGILYGVLKDLGIQCDAMAGHSAGELSALLASNAIAGSTEQFAKLCNSFNSIATEKIEGRVAFKLLALGASSEKAQMVLDDARLELGVSVDDFCCYLAMYNCTRQTVIVGRADHAIVVEKHLKKRGMIFQELELDQPYHTSLFKPMMGPLREMFRQIDFQIPEEDVYSCTTAELFPADADQIRELAVSHWESPVQFVGLIENLYDNGVRIFLESGPRNNLSSFCEDILRGRDCLIAPTSVPRHSALTQINHFVAQLAVHQVDIEYSKLYQESMTDGEQSLVNQIKTGDRENSEPEENNNSVQQKQLNPLSQDLSQSQPGPVSKSVGQPPVPVSNPASLQSYFGVMDSFLEMQQEVMQSYLANRNQAPKRPNNRRDNRRPGRHRALANNNPNASAKAPSYHSTTSDQGLSTQHIHNAPFQGPASAAPETQPKSNNTVPNRPLVGEIIEHEPHQRIELHRVLDIQLDTYLAHHTVGGRNLSEVALDQCGLPVVPMTFTLEMVSQIGELLSGGQVVSSIENVKLLRWVAFEDEPIVVRATATMRPEVGEDNERKVDVAIDLLPVGFTDIKKELKPAASATVFVRDHRKPAPVAKPLELVGERPKVVGVETLYKNLFHGEMFQCVQSIDRYGENGTEATLEVLPRDELFSTKEPDFVADPVLLDAMFHPICAWHLEQEDQSGRIMLPIGLNKIEFFGDCPSVGRRFVSTSINDQITSRQFTHTFELIDDENRVYYRVDKASFWRFYLPFKKYNFHGPKNVYMMSDECPDFAPPRLQWEADWEQEEVVNSEASLCIVKLEIPTDLLNPTLQPVAARVTLSGDEFQEFKNLDVGVDRKTEWLFGRIAAKDAARTLWRKMTGKRLFLADIEVQHDSFGQPLANLRGEKSATFPNISIAHCGKTMVAAAAEGRVGIDFEKIEQRGEGFLNIAFSKQELELLDQVDNSIRPQWETRFWSAKEATGKSTGFGLLDGPKGVEVVDFDVESGEVLVQLRRVLAENCPELADENILVHTKNVGQFVFALTTSDQSVSAH